PSAASSAVSAAPSMVAAVSSVVTAVSSAAFSPQAARPSEAARTSDKVIDFFIWVYPSRLNGSTGIRMRTFRSGALPITFRATISPNWVQRPFWKRGPLFATARRGRLPASGRKRRPAVRLTTYKESFICTFMTELLDIFRALADPTRLRIVALLREMELAIGELALVLEQSQPRVSRHVRILVDAGIIERRREGSWVFLRIVAQGPVSNMIARAEEWPFSPREALVVAHDARRLAAVRADRVAAAERYFAEHAAEWDAIRSRHVAESEVEAAMLAMVAGRRLGHLLDIGTGTGRMAEIFAPTVRRITALDRSPDMLRIARAKLADQPVPIDLVQGDFLNLPMADASIDSIVIHQA